MLSLPTLLSAILGWCTGLLINYLADFLPDSNSPSQPACPACRGHQPWTVYLPWPRPCPGCARRPGLRAWLSPSLGALAGLYCWLYPIQELGAILSFLILAYFGLVMIIDSEHHLILLSTSIFGALLGLLAGWLRLGWRSTLVGGLAGLGLLFAIYLLGILFGRILSGLRGKAINETVFGFGDVMLGSVIGLMVGWPDILHSLWITILSAGIFSLIYLIFISIMGRYRLGIAIPYGPFLILGAILIITTGLHF